MTKGTSVAVARRRWHIPSVVILALALLAAVAPYGHADTGEPKWRFHVAPWGDDSWTGTRGRPFATLKRAQRSVRANTAKMKRDIIVNLHPGVHTLAAPLRLRSDAGDSGRNGHRVIYQAYRYGHKRQKAVILSGGRRVTGWRLDDRDKNTWRAKVGNLDTRQLYINGKRATRARLDIVGKPAGLPGNVTETDQGYVTDSTEPQTWKNPKDLEVVYYGPFVYTHPRCGIADISGDAQSTTITMDQPCYRWFRQHHVGTHYAYGPLPENREPHEPQDDDRWEFAPPAPVWIENSKSFLTQAGTFYLDRSNPGDHVLYYIPRRGETLARAKVVAPVLERLVDGKGAPGSPLHDISFRGITFSHATWTGPSKRTGFINVFGPIYEAGDTPHFRDPFDSSKSARSVPGNVRFRHARGIVIEGSRFQRLGSDALEFSLGSSRNVIRGNIVNNVSGGGIQVGSRQPDTELDRINRGNVIKNNHVHDIGLEYHGSIGIYVEKTQNARVAHNQVNDTPYSGISFGEYWSHYPGNRTTAYGNRIVNNRIFNVVTVMADGGGIFTASHQGNSYRNGTVVSGNWIHDIVGSAAGPVEGFEVGGVGLYLDDSADFITWRKNVAYNPKFDTISGCPLHNTMTHNFFEAPPLWWCYRGGPYVVYENNTHLGENDPGQACAAIPECAKITRKAGLEPRYRDLLAE